jgi:hypothetical protein
MQGQSDAVAAESLAVLADIHGNRWALEAVLADIRGRGIRAMVNLGDSLYGPLDPAGTPHARYAVIRRGCPGLEVENATVAYDWERAAAAADGNGRADWAHALRTGRASME